MWFCRCRAGDRGAGGIGGVDLGVRGIFLVFLGWGGASVSRLCLFRGVVW